MKYQTYTARVKVDGARLAEYGTSTSTEGGVPCVSCWVPSEAGKTFMIKCGDAQAARPPSSWRFFVDGTRVSKKILEGADVVRDGTLALRDVRAGGARRRLLLFADLQTTEDDAAEGRASAELGEIAVHVLPVRVLKRHTAHTKAPVRLDGGAVHERSKKAGAHVVGLGPLSDRAHTSLTATEVIGAPLVKFVFRYRPLALLQAQGIAPPPALSASSTPAPNRSDSPDVLEVKDEPKDDDARQLWQTQASTAPTPAARVKRESPPRRPHLMGVSGDVIDLTSN